MQRIDPTDITGINEQLRSWAAGRETLRPVAIGHLVIEDEAIPALAELVRTLAGGGRVLMLTDRTVMQRGGDDVKTVVADALGRVAPLTRLEWPPDPSETFHPDLETARTIAEKLAHHAAIVSVGSGSVTDVAKYARHLVAEQTPSSSPAFISFPTAASVTAFTSALAVLSRDGVKRTLASRGPDAVVCDLRTIADAPLLMTQAGFGDVLARSVAYGDWYLSIQLGMDDPFSELPGRLLAAAEQAMIDRAAGVAVRDPAAVRAVLEAVLLAGMAMSIVNQTAPISGWEHVISHYLDMTADHDGRELALHGGQVGAATLVAARAYERAWPGLDVDRLTAETTEADVAALRQQIERRFRPYDSSGAMAAEIWRDSEIKIKRWQSAIEQRRQFAARKRAGEFEEFLNRNVRSSAAVAAALSAAGAPKRFADLNHPIPRDAAFAAVRSGHLIRTRFTLGDLLDQSGWLNDDSAASLLEE